jgi:hypothetical protein
VVTAEERGEDPEHTLRKATAGSAALDVGELTASIEQGSADDVITRLTSANDERLARERADPTTPE